MSLSWLLFCEVLTNGKWYFIKIKKVKIAEVKGYKDYIHVDVGFTDPDYPPPLRNGIQFSTFLKFNTSHRNHKAAIRNKQIAVFLLTKIYFFRLAVCQKYSLFIQFAASKLFKVFHLLKNPCSIVLKEILYKSHLCKLNTERDVAISPPPSVCNIAIRCFMSLRWDAKNEEIADKPGFYAVLRYSSGCRSPPSISDFEIIEDKLIKAEMLAKLMEAMGKLSRQEWRLIYELFFNGKTETALAVEWGINQSNINRRKVRILSKLKKFLEI